MLEIRNLTAGYRGRVVLHDLSLDLPPNRLTGIIGPNGCGKSTLLKAALGLIPRVSGDVRANGQPLDRLKRHEIAGQVAYLAQGRDVPDMTVEQMVLQGRFPYLHYPHGYSRRDYEKARAAMERVGITSIAGEPLAALSGGMRQTAYIAMALAQDTPYMLLDEPTTYLDPAHQFSLMGLLREITRDGRGVAAVMHDLPLALTFSDRVAVMAEGRVVACATPREIVASGVIEEVFGICVREDSDGFRVVYEIGATN